VEDLNWWQKLLFAPVALIFTCEWHRIHFALVFIGGVVLFLGVANRSLHLAALGIGIGLPSLVCLMLAPAIGIPVLLIGQGIAWVMNYFRLEQR
jgi:hypothetical protein